MKPILFNTDMVRAILDGRKTVTRRAVKPRFRVGEQSWQVITEKHSGKYVRIEYLDEWEDVTRYMKEPFLPGDILYVRETFCRFDPDHIVDGNKYAYYADATPESERIRKEYGYKWRPSIHMPKEAARLFLRVTDVRVERLQDITEDQAHVEGCYSYRDLLDGVDSANFDLTARDAFGDVWESTIKPADRPIYGWEANPWVWVIEFERISKEMALELEKGA